MRRICLGAATALLSLSVFSGGLAATAPDAPANFSAYDQPVKKPKKKTTAAPYTKQSPQQSQMKQRPALKPQLTAQARPRPVIRQARCIGFFRCMFWQPSPRVAAVSVGGIDRPTRTMIDWSSDKYVPGTIIVKTPERALYYVLPGGEAFRYQVGVGREGFQWSGSSKIVMKQEWPSWRPPKRMIEREAAKGHIIPDFMDGGPDNPLGARAMYIGGTLFRIHGTNNAASIGGAVSSGCIRMMNADVIDLYDRVKIGSPVYVYQ